MALNCKKVTLEICSIVAIIFGVLYASTRLELLRQDVDHTADVGLGTFADPLLKSVSVLFRHGDRAPIFEYKTYPNMYKNDFPEGKGKLTKIGKRHMYQKGKLLRRLYNVFISDLYLDCEISIKTTNISRTFMSAAMVLAGMYPPKDYQKWSDLETVWQPIPIFNDSPDRTLVYGDKCPYFKEFFLKKNSNQIVKSINIENENQTEELLSYLSEKCGQPITFHDLIALCDLFISKTSNGLELPEWIQPNHIKILESIYMQFFRAIYRDKKLQKLIIGPLLKEICLNMELRSNSSNSNTTRSMHLYAGHDFSVGSVIYFLDNNSTITPEFGASVHFHLYVDKIKEYIIKVFYYHKWDDEKGEEMSIPICGNPCKLEDFVEHINKSFSKEWEKECENIES